jgi:hypothetical protein
MLGDIRFAGSLVLFSASKSICFSPSPPPQLLEAIEIATTDVKMLMEELPNNTAW